MIVEVLYALTVRNQCSQAHKLLRVCCCFPLCSLSSSLREFSKSFVNFSASSTRTLKRLHTWKTKDFFTDYTYLNCRVSLLTCKPKDIPKLTRMQPPRRARGTISPSWEALTISEILTRWNTTLTNILEYQLFDVESDRVSPNTILAIQRVGANTIGDLRWWQVTRALQEALLTLDVANGLVEECLDELFHSAVKEQKRKTPRVRRTSPRKGEVESNETGTPRLVHRRMISKSKRLPEEIRKKIKTGDARPRRALRPSAVQEELPLRASYGPPAARSASSPKVLPISVTTGPRRSTRIRIVSPYIHPYSRPPGSRGTPPSPQWATDYRQPHQRPRGSRGTPVVTPPGTRTSKHSSTSADQQLEKGLLTAVEENIDKQLEARLLQKIDTTVEDMVKEARKTAKEQDEEIERKKLIGRMREYGSR